MILECTFCKRQYCDGCEGSGSCWECEQAACDICLVECVPCGAMICGDCAGHCDDGELQDLE